MAEEVVASGGFTTKEMLVRMDGKLDVLAGRQQHLDIEVAMLKERVHQVEGREKQNDGEERDFHLEMRAELHEAKTLAAQARLEAQQLGRKLAYATGSVAAVVVLANLLVPWLLSRL